ncbi:MAG: transcriptional regulator, partial [Vicinamibacterales bacterium]|nr:transcriptional regulator [Vicinamibacterales bacterium]
MAGQTLAFGPFRLDLRAHRLLRGDAPVPLSAHLVDLLALFASRAGELLTKDAIFAAAWPDVFVTDNTLARAVADLRRALGDDPAAPRYLQTVARRGYRFVAPVTAVDDRPATPAPDPAGAFDELRQFVASVTDLERLRVDHLDDVITRLERAAGALPDYAPVQVALASAWTIAAESRRAEATRDRTTVERAIAAAERARALDPALGEAWATLAFALACAGRWEEARAAARQAVRLEPESWRHHFRLALAAWGEERLRAAQRTLTLMPGFPYACFLGATVLVARGVLERAGDLAAQGLAGSEHATADERLPASGLHWLTGAVAAATGRHGEALALFAREIDAHDAGRLYSTEFVVNA